MDGPKIVAAWTEWLESEEGRKASGSNLEDLQESFFAGAKFGAAAVADDVIAAMEKEKQP